MNVLSLFDGMSCGQIALDRAGIHVNKYYAAEIDKYAVKVTTANYPETVCLGDVTKWREWEIDWSNIDLLIGGSPCQGFSSAGKGLNFNDPRSSLFFTYVEILVHIMSFNSSVRFMLENVKMKKSHLESISMLLGVEPIFINSALVSAQNRQRFYWCNWSTTQPSDKGIKLADIIESDNVDRVKSYCLDANYYKGGNPKQYFNKGRRQLVFKGARITGRYLIDGKRQDHKVSSMKGLTNQRLEIRKDHKTNCLTSVSKDSVVAISSDDYRKLTPIECERLQTVPDNYTSCVSNTQRYKMLGNGWTVDVIAHLLSQL